jgi:hypothetical protein
MSLTVVLTCVPGGDGYGSGGYLRRRSQRRRGLTTRADHNGIRRSPTCARSPVLTDRSARLLSASAAGVVLADPRGELRAAAASSDEARLVELFQVQNDQGPCLECLRTGENDQGPCLECLRTGEPVTAVGLAEPGQRWPRFAAAATGAGFGAVNALPMRLRDQDVAFGCCRSPFRGHPASPIAGGTVRCGWRARRQGRCAGGRRARAR